ncbi:hypothetical protein BGX31_005494, partial [Mortierella sp. GBA43]
MKDYQMASVVIGFELMEDSQSAETICRTLHDVLRQWGLEGKVICITTDSANNMKKAIELYQSTSEITSWFPCSAHKIQLIISKGLPQRSK